MSAVIECFFLGVMKRTLLDRPDHARDEAFRLAGPLVFGFLHTQEFYKSCVHVCKRWKSSMICRHWLCYSDLMRCYRNIQRAQVRDLRLIQASVPVFLSNVERLCYWYFGPDLDPFHNLDLKNLRHLEITSCDLSQFNFEASQLDSLQSLRVSIVVGDSTEQEQHLADRFLWILNLVAPELASLSIQLDESDLEQAPQADLLTVSACRNRFPKLESIFIDTDNFRAVTCFTEQTGNNNNNKDANDILWFMINNRVQDLEYTATASGLELTSLSLEFFGMHRVQWACLRTVKEIHLDLEAYLFASKCTDMEHDLSDSQSKAKLESLAIELFECLCTNLPNLEQVHYSFQHSSEHYGPELAAKIREVYANAPFVVQICE